MARIAAATGRRRGGMVVLLAGLLLLVGSITGLGAKAAPAPKGGGFSTDLAAEQGQNPMPSGVDAVPEDCKGIAPTNGSANAITQKQSNDGQGLIKPGAANSYLPGGTVHWLIKYNSDAKPTSKSFDIRDCVVEFLPGNKHLADVKSLIDTGPNGHGQIIVVGPGSTPDVKGFDNVLDNAEFDFASNQVMPGEFDLSWVVPTDAPAGALICNYAKDTGGNTKGGKENRKAAACFTVQSVPTTTTVPQTTTTTQATTTTTVPQTTTTVPVTTTTVPVTTTSSVPEVTTTTQPEETTTTTEPETTTTTGPCESTTTTTGQCGTTTTSSIPEVTTTVPETTTTTAPCESTTTTTGECGTTTTTVASTTTTAVAGVATTVKTNVLGESFQRGAVNAQPLAKTGSNVTGLLFWAGLALALGGLAIMVRERESETTS